MTTQSKRPASKILDGLKDALRHAKGEIAVKTTRVERGYVFMAADDCPQLFQRNAPHKSWLSGRDEYPMYRTATLLIDMGKQRTPPAKRKQKVKAK